jgi:hypothetical protein
MAESFIGKIKRVVDEDDHFECVYDNHRLFMACGSTTHFVDKSTGEEYGTILMGHLSSLMKDGTSAPVAQIVFPDVELEVENGTDIE